MSKPRRTTHRRRLMAAYVAAEAQWVPLTGLTRFLPPDPAARALQRLAARGDARVRLIHDEPHYSFSPVTIQWFGFVPASVGKETFMDESRAISFRYTNWRGETAWRYATPISLRFEASEWHPEEQNILVAFDHDKGAERSFALRDCDFTSTCLMGEAQGVWVEGPDDDGLYWLHLRDGDAQSSINLGVMDEGTTPELFRKLLSRPTRNPPAAAVLAAWPERNGHDAIERELRALAEEKRISVHDGDEAVSRLYRAIFGL